MSAPLTATGPPASPTDAVSKEKDVFTDSDGTVSSGYSTPAKAESLLLADRPKAYTTGRGPITDNFLNFFRIKGKHRDSEALDDIATQPSVYDGPQAQHYQPRDDWEVRYATCSWYGADSRTSKHSIRRSGGHGEKSRKRSARSIGKF